MNYIRLIVLYVVVVLILHVIPTGDIIALNQMKVAQVRADYLLHSLIFLPYMVLVWLHSYKSKAGRVLETSQVLLWFVGGLALAVFAEGLQYFIPYRSFNITDLIFNTSGVPLGALIFIWRPAQGKIKNIKED